ncbi:hypothetical protein Lalb_Chr21g0308551 [Lupinus albus]|uniref:DUF4228 domain-containing protein n=1 Tax=Lupinus albus TaxID=3870 RepID=A0A6A4NP65_LUPAL|nr:hypothetical protein Lalb_Chr21g0308551 [Lupinus albus]
MGNYISCTFIPPLTKNTKSARVIFPTSEVKQFKEIVKAAELMLELPNYFLANSRSLHVGRRFHALGADDELEFGNVYIFFPIRRVNSFVTAADVAVLLMAASSTAKRISGGKTRVQPDNGGGERRQLNEEENNKNGVARLNLEGVELIGFHNRLSYCRSRKPVLETINEESIKIRGRIQC